MPSFEYVVPPAAWRLEYRDYSGHRLGSPPPPRQRREFMHQEGALAELHRLRAAPRAEIVGSIAPVHPKSPATQEDFGFPLATGPPRMTP
jgi:hypothetical protein